MGAIGGHGGGFPDGGYTNLEPEPNRLDGRITVAMDWFVVISARIAMFDLRKLSIIIIAMYGPAPASVEPETNTYENIMPRLNLVNFYIKTIVFKYWNWSQPSLVGPQLKVRKPFDAV
ncbi:MAG: hypothetical protein VCF08_08630 [Alphaproteobacteria bacterium]|jgi:hypothetical protein